MKLKSDHSYETIRRVILDIVSGREKVEYDLNQFAHLQIGVAEVLVRRETGGAYGATASLSDRDKEMFRDVFWDLFRQGIITLGCDNSNTNYPFFRVSHFGSRILEHQELYFFHDVSSYEQVVRENIPDIDEVTVLYAKEAMQAYLSGCLLSATVMIGVAAEDALDTLMEAVADNHTARTDYAAALKERHVLNRLRRFREILERQSHDLSPQLKEGLGTNLLGIAELIRTYRNESGHPTGKIVSREQCYILLQLFIPYCSKVYALAAHFRQPEQTQTGR